MSFTPGDGHSSVALRYETYLLTYARSPLPRVVRVSRLLLFCVLASHDAWLPMRDGIMLAGAAAAAPRVDAPPERAVHARRRGSACTAAARGYSDLCGCGARSQLGPSSSANALPGRASAQPACSAQGMGLWRKRASSACCAGPRSAQTKSNHDSGCFALSASFSSSSYQSSHLRRGRAQEA